MGGFCFYYPFLFLLYFLTLSGKYCIIIRVKESSFVVWYFPL